MAFRTIEISKPSEIHIKKALLSIANPEDLNEEVLIPLEDIATITCIGNNIRFSSMALNQITANGIMLMSLDEKYSPTSIVIPCEGYYSQSLVMKKQINMSKTKIDKLWCKIIKKKIENQSKALAILGKDGYKEVLEYSKNINSQNVDSKEALAAKDYFEYYHPSLNRRTDDPINSALNYGYAVIRNAIARAAVAAGFLISYGLHHDNQFNSMNLIDDLIEPFRHMVDIIAIKVAGNNVELTKPQRYKLAHILHNACVMNNQKLNMLNAIDIMLDSMRQYVVEDRLEVLLPDIIPEESMELLNE